MPRSLHGFCKTHNLTKSRVYNHLVDLGYDLSQGMSDAAVDAATREFLTVQAAAPVDDIPTSPTQVMPPAGYSDPFAGLDSGDRSAIVPAGFHAQDRALATTAAAQRVQQICLGANLHAQQTVAAALDSGDQMGQQLGAFLAERTIAAAESQRQQLIQQYLQAQGVQTDPKQPPAPAA